MNLPEHSEFLKPSPEIQIQIQGKITNLQRSAWNVLLANAYDELPNQEIHRISIAELAKGLGFDSPNEEYLKETLEALVNCIVKWNVLINHTKDGSGVASLLGSAEIKNGICTYSFAPHLRYKLYNPRTYTKLNLRLQKRITSRYAFILWEICFDAFDFARNQGETPCIPLDTFKALMGIALDDYPTFKTLNQRVIKPAIKEINELTNYSIEIEHKRIGRKIGEMKFKISQFKEPLSVEPVQETVSLDIEGFSPTAIKLVRAGISPKEARRIAKEEWLAVDLAPLPEGTKFAAYVEEKISLAHHATDVKNAGRFIVKAIRENYQNPVFQAQLQERKHREQQAILDSLKSEMLEKKKALLREAVRTNPELLEQAYDRFSIPRELLKNYNSSQEAYRDGGIGTALINAILISRDRGISTAEINAILINRQLLKNYNSPQEAYRGNQIGTVLINAILAEDICTDLIASVNAAYEDEKARILGTAG